MFTSSTNQLRIKQCLGTISLALGLFAAEALAAPVTEPGTVISNTAFASWQQAGEARNTESNTVQTSTTIFQTPAEISLLRISSNAGKNSQPAEIDNPQCSDGADGYVEAAQATNRNEPVGDDAKLSTAEAYVAGEPIYIEVADADQNLDDEAVEFVELTIRTNNNDQEQIRINETGVNTGIFAGYIQTVQGQVQQFDCLLSVSRNTEVSVEYTDRFDNSELEVASALIDPYGIVFNSVTGAPENGISVTLIDVSSGQPATVFADDGVTPWPSTVTTGDASLGFAAGEYRFPLVFEGEYRLQLAGSNLYSFPSTVPAASLPNNPSDGSPYTIVTGSYGENFLVPEGPPVRVDIAIDRLQEGLVLEKTAAKRALQQGDFVRFNLQLHNTASRDAVATVISDQMPLGMRYQAGSARINGIAAVDPVIAANGRELSFETGDLAAGDSLSLSYVVRISAGAAVGKATNQANALAQGGLISNLAQASVNVEAAFQQGSFTLVGRVMETDCSADDRPARPVSGVRVYLENGRYAVTDEDGQYRFAGLSTRSHVVQVDQATLPPQYEAQFCNQDSRYAGTPFSRFVEGNEASLWRADFYVKQKQPAKSTAALRMQSRVEGGLVHYELEFQANKIAVENGFITVMMPDGLQPLVNSATLDGEALRLRSREGAINVALKRSGTDFSSVLKFTAEPTLMACDLGRLDVRAVGRFTTAARKRNRTPLASNSLLCTSPEAEPEQYVYRPQFGPLGTTLQAEDKQALDALAARLLNRPLLSLTVRGHTDSDLIPPRNHHLFKDNKALAYARAKAVAKHLAQALAIDVERVAIDAVGAAEQVATNLTAEGKAQNRRVEVILNVAESKQPPALSLLQNDSGYQAVAIEGQGWTPIDQWSPELFMQQTPEQFDQAWLRQQNADFELLLPTAGYNPPGVSTPVVVKHAAKQRVQVLLNGSAVNALNFEGQQRTPNGQVLLSTWKGVDLKAGDNELTVQLLGDDGRVVDSMTRTVRRSTEPAYAELIAEQSRLQIDGFQPATLAIRITDRDGAPVARGTIGEFRMTSDHESLEAAENQQRHGSNEGQPARSSYQVIDDNGMALIRLAPTAKPGLVTLELASVNADGQEVQAWLSEKPRDWILVGLAEGSLSQSAPVGSVQSADGKEVYSDGRAAFFAKGRILGSALLTLRYDSSRNETKQFGHGGGIDPNAWYSLYGDRSFSGQEAASQEKLYVRVERDAFYASYGDMNTGFNVVELANYQRSLTGLKSELRGRYVSYNLFAAETETGFMRDQLPGDGTSGYFRLSQVPVLNSEQIVLETRDRLRSHEVVDRRVLRRYFDYQINYQDGSLFFREPVPVRDADLNPVYIVAEYEVADGGEKVVTAGARVALHDASRRMLLGLTAVSEDEPLASRSLIAVDGRVRLSANTDLKLEYGETRRDIAGVNLAAAGKLLEINHRGKGLRAQLYFRELEAGYGLGSVAGSENATRKMGVTAELEVSQGVSLTADVADEKNLSQGNSRAYAELGLKLKNSNGHVQLGFRHAQDETAAGERSESEQAVLDVRQTFFNNFIGFSARYEAALSERNAAADFPERVLLGLDVRVAPSTLLFLKQEFTQGAERDTRSTRVGLQSELWKGANLQSYIAQENNADGQRLYTGNNISQYVELSDTWWASIGFDQSATLRDQGATALNGNTPLANGTDNDFKAGHVSLGRKSKAGHWDLRYEVHKTNQSHRDAVVSSWRRFLSQGRSLDFALRWLNDEQTQASNQRLETEFGLAVRPIEAKWFFLNRLRLLAEDQQDASNGSLRSSRIVNQFNANYLPNERNQWSLFFGAKYQRDTIDGQAYSGAYSQLGLQYRYSINEYLDWGFQLSTHTDWAAKNERYSAGLQLGVSPLKNVWVSLGYNWAGFADQDFDAAAWTSHGAYLRFRFKFDQQSTGLAGRSTGN